MMNGIVREHIICAVSGIINHHSMTTLTGEPVRKRVKKTLLLWSRNDTVTRCLANFVLKETADKRVKKLSKRKVVSSRKVKD